MFRALLWKEWRELWLGLVGAVLYVGACFVFLPRGNRIDPEIWQIAFTLGLFIASVYIPTHLYAKEKDSGTVGFIFSKPLDRFRLWWFRLAIGLTVLIAIGLVLYGAITALSHFYVKVSSYEARRLSIVWTSICVSILVFGLSCLTSTTFRKQIAGLVGCLLILFGCWMFWSFLSGPFSPFYQLRQYFLRNLIPPAILLIPCPLLLFFSLVMFARHNLKRETRARIIISYAVMAIVALCASTAVIASLSGGKMMGVIKAKPEILLTYNISRDGNRILAVREPGRLLVSIDMAERRLYELDRQTYWFRTNDTEDGIIYTKWQYRNFLDFVARIEVILSDFRGTHKEHLFNSWLRSPYPSSWSLDGKYFGVLTRGSFLQDRPPFISLYNSTGEVLGKTELPLMESDSFLHPLGWDYESRLYFTKSLTKRNNTSKTCWRIRSDTMTMEEVPFLNDCWYSQISPDGKWVAASKEKSGTSSGWELGLYDVAHNTGRRISGDYNSFSWSQDGKQFAYIENAAVKSEGNKPSRDLVLYEPDSGKADRISLKGFPEIDGVGSWSYSNDYLLLSTGERSKNLILFLTKSQQFEQIPKPSKGCGACWIEGDKIVWTTENRLVITEHDGSNPQEILRVEGHKFYFYGEEQRD